MYGKMCHKQHRRVKPEDKAQAVDFGDLVTGDHFIKRHDGDGAKEAEKDEKEDQDGETRVDAFSDSEVFYEGAQNAEVAFGILDRGTGWVHVFPRHPSLLITPHRLYANSLEQTK